MKEWTKELGKTFLFMQLPLYGVFLWVFMQLGLSYWSAWFGANCAYTPVIYAINRFTVFRRRIKTNVEM